MKQSKTMPKPKGNTFVNPVGKVSMDIVKSESHHSSAVRGLYLLTKLKEELFHKNLSLLLKRVSKKQCRVVWLRGTRLSMLRLLFTMDRTTKSTHQKRRLKLPGLWRFKTRQRPQNRYC